MALRKPELLAIAQRLGENVEPSLTVAAIIERIRDILKKPPVGFPITMDRPVALLQ